MEEAPHTQPTTHSSNASDDDDGIAWQAGGIWVGEADPVPVHVDEHEEMRRSVENFLNTN